ncbi:hypothetical protein [Spirosoma utsteinense]|uniref:DUF4369 domain-containing protein n=1 Tax=Spirosoma utsteinense TaxID=2585773 RepID=A0ABR6WGY6_9BACT|nr:hypothetical protein [Spirosoma utsteinense]MBC3789519.1 hypothetical protein [Spirosoma utsteinense]MBC3795400.1 hypothetical protein [Spirosoma utsteinense]
MQKKILWIGLVLVLTSCLQGNAQYAKQDSTYKRWFVGSTIFLLGNLASTNRPDFVQLNLGYRITGKDVIILNQIDDDVFLMYGKQLNAMTLPESANKSSTIA